jgi:hypothetical protein
MRDDAAVAASGSPPPERIPFLENRNTLWRHLLAHILIGELVATSPGYALKRGARVEDLGIGAQS